MRWKFWSGEKSDRSKEGEPKKPNEVKPKPNVIEIPDQQLAKPKPIGGLKDQGQDAFKAERTRKIGVLAGELTPLEGKLVKGVVVVRRDGPEKLTAKSFEGGLTTGELTEFIEAAERNQTGMRIMEGQMFKRICAGKADKMPAYAKAIAGLNKKVNARFPVGLEENPDHI